MSAEKIVKLFMLIGAIALCGFGYIYISGNLGMSTSIVGNTTDNQTIVAQNSTFYHQGQGLVLGSNMIGYAVLLLIIFLFLAMLFMVLRDNGYL